MLNVQRYSSTFTPGVCARHQECADPFRATGFAARAREHDAVSRDVHAGRPHLLAVDAPAVDALRVSRHRARFHMSRVGAVLRLGQSERDDDFAFEAAADELFFLRGAAEVAHHHDEGKVADHRMLVLQIVVQPEPCDARCSRITAIHRFEPPSPPYSRGSEKR